MRIRGSHIPQILLGLALIAALMWNLAYGAEVRWVQMDMTANGTRAEIGLDTAADYKLLRLSNPARLAVDFPASRLGARFAPPPGMGVVRAVRHGQPVPGTVRIVFDLTQSVAVREPRIERENNGVKLVLEWPGSGSTPVATIAPPPAAPRAPPPPVSPSAPPQSAPPAADNSNTLAWPVNEPERIALPQPNGTVPPIPPGGASRLRPGAPITGVGLPAATPAPHVQPAHGTPAEEALDPIARIAAAHQTGATGHPTPAATATPVAVSVSARDEPPPAAQAVSTAAAPARAPASPPHTPQLRPLMIAIDPGHGGRDPGAIGSGGSYEKHIVLAIARELAKQINATPGMRAMLIRDTDIYVELPERARRAREAKADMFVSIHADAAQNRNAHGASVYTLSTTGASSQHARWLADQENSVDLIGGVQVENSTLSNVLLDLAHSGHMKASQDAASHVLTGLSSVGKAHKREVEYANFSVLRNADMPAMLVETGFISNPAEEKRLKDPAHQRKVAGAILKGIDAFFRNQPPPGTLFAAHVAGKRAYAEAGSGPP